MNAECANADTSEIGKLDLLIDLVERLALHMDEHPECDGMVRFDDWIVTILNMLIEEAVDATKKLWALSRRVSGAKVETPAKLLRRERRLMRLERTREESLFAIRDLVEEEPAARLLRDIGFTYHKVVEYICELASNAVAMAQDLFVTPTTPILA